MAVMAGDMLLTDPATGEERELNAKKVIFFRGEALFGFDDFLSPTQVAALRTGRQAWIAVRPDGGALRTLAALS